MANRIIQLRHPLPYADDETYQEFGDQPFYLNGGVKLGPTYFAYGSPIHRHRFGANLLACRNIEEPNILEIETPFGSTLRFLYRPLYRTWYQLVDVDDPRLYLHQERYGTRIAIGLFYIRAGIRWTFIESLRLLIGLLCIVILVLIARYFD